MILGHVTNSCEACGFSSFLPYGLAWGGANLAYRVLLLGGMFVLSCSGGSDAVLRIRSIFDCEEKYVL